MGSVSEPGAVIELSDGLSLVPCTVVSLSFVRADVSVKPVDEWQLKGGLTAMFKKKFGLVVADRDLVVHKEKNYFKKRRDEPIADGTLHLWGGGSTAKGLLLSEGADLGKYVVENVNGVELSIGGLKLKCLAVVKETNNFEALKRAWEVAFGPRRGGGAQQGPGGGPTTLTLKDVPSRWFAEPRVSSKPSVLVTHTIFSSFGEIRNLEVLSNEDSGSNLKAVGSIAATLQCQIWVQFDNHTNFCKALHAFCGRAMQKAGSNFRSMYVVDWDKENYFSVLNVRKRKFEKERLERQLQAEAERKLTEEMEARQAEFLRAEVERLKLEQMAAALREEERQQELANEARKLEEEAREKALYPDSSSEEEGLIQDERQASSDDEMPPSDKEMKGHRLEQDDRFSPPQRLNERFIGEIEGERHLQRARGKGDHTPEAEEAVLPSRTREKRRFSSEDSEEEEARSPRVSRDKRRDTIQDRRDTVPVRAKRRGTSEELEVQHLKKRKYTSESESETEDEEQIVRRKRTDNSKLEPERGSPEVWGKRKYSYEDEEERQPPHSKENRRYTSDEDEEILPPPEKKVAINKHGGRNTHVPEESDDQEMYNPLERWQPEEKTIYYSKSPMRNITHAERSPGPVDYGRMASRKRSPSPLTTEKEKEEEEEESEDDKYVEPEAGRRKEGNSNMERWSLEETHSVASLIASDMLHRQAHKRGLATMDRFEKRLRSVIMIST